MGNAELTARDRDGSFGIPSYLLVAIWCLEAFHLSFPVTALREAGGVCLLMFVGLALLRASQHLRILRIALFAIAPAAAGYSHTWVAIPRRRESALIFGAFLTAMLLIRATAEESSHAISIRERLIGMGPVQRAGWAPPSSHVLGAVLNVDTMTILSPMVPADFSTSPGRGFNRDYGDY